MSVPAPVLLHTLLLQLLLLPGDREGILKQPPLEMVMLLLFLGDAGPQGSVGRAWIPWQTPDTRGDSRDSPSHTSLCN